MGKLQATTWLMPENMRWVQQYARKHNLPVSQAINALVDVLRQGDLLPDDDQPPIPAPQENGNRLRALELLLNHTAQESSITRRLVAQLLAENRPEAEVRELNARAREAAAKALRTVTGE